MPADVTTIQTIQDRQLRQKLSSDKGVSRAIARLKETFSGFGFGARRRLLSGALRLTRSMAPDVADALESCRESIGYKHPVEIFVRPEAMFNAFCMKDPSNHVVIGLSSRLLESFSPPELQFVIGHELGHAAFDHFGIPMPNTAAIRDLAGRMVSRPIALELFLWCRTAELSADRVGLVCSKDPEAAANSFFKLASGLSSQRIKADLEAFASQVDSLASAPEARSEPHDEDDSLDSFCTHPYSPVRVRALLAFSKSQMYQNYIGQEPTGMSDADLEEIIQRDLSLMEPSYLEEKNTLSELMRKMLYNAGLMVAAANGVIEDSEIESLRALLGDRVTDDSTQDDMDKVRKEFAEQAEESKREVTLAQRLRLIQHLTIIAAADGSVDNMEMGELAKICTMIDVPVTIVDQTLAGAESPMD
ncbi:MAG: M48 family metalloprotease [Deltaproteobacteria bacterium]|nr:M48 family metalloprotease [Deltaproteobacteria bacterium]